MSTSRLDTYIPDYVFAAPVTSGVTLYGPIVPLYGACGFSVQGLTQQSAAGTMAINATNFAAAQLSQLLQANGNPFAEYTSSQAIGTNGHAGMKATLTDNAINFSAFYVSFAPTASGILYIAVNVRRFNS